MPLTLPQRDLTRVSKDIPREALDILHSGFFAYLGTSDPRCTPHVTAMFYIWDDKTRTLHLVASKLSKKILNIRANSKVSVTVDQRDPISPARNSGVMVAGNAFLIEMELVDKELMSNYMAKYSEFLDTGYPPGSRIAIRVVPRRLSYWKGTTFYTWKNPQKGRRRTADKTGHES